VTVQPAENEDAVDAGIDVSTIGPMQLIGSGSTRVDFVGAIIEEIDRLQDMACFACSTCSC